MFLYGMATLCIISRCLSMATGVMWTHFKVMLIHTLPILLYSSVSWGNKRSWSREVVPNTMALNAVLVNNIMRYLQLNNVLVNNIMRYLQLNTMLVNIMQYLQLSIVLINNMWYLQLNTVLANIIMWYLQLNTVGKQYNLVLAIHCTHHEPSTCLSFLV